MQERGFMRAQGVPGRAIGAMALAGAVSLAGTARANDSTFGGEAADLVPLDETRVSMVSEDIHLEYRAGDWYVTADYVFKNDADTPVSLQVGFPETRCFEDGSDCVGQPFRNLVTKVDGKPALHRTGKVSKKHEWAKHTSVVWLFDAVFAPHSETRIGHSYSLPSGGDVSMN